MFWWSNLREITKWKKLRQSLQVIYKMYENIMSKNKTNGGQLNSLTKTAYDNAWIYHVFILYILKWSQQFSDRFACIRRKRKCRNRWMHIYLNSLIYSMQMILLYLSILNMQRAFTCFKHTAITANSISRPIKRTCVLCSEKIKVKHGHMTFILISFFLWKKKRSASITLWQRSLGLWEYRNFERIQFKFLSIWKINTVIHGVWESSNQHNNRLWDWPLRQSSCFLKVLCGHTM